MQDQHTQEPVGWFKYDKVSQCWHPQYEKYAPTHAEREGWQQLYAFPPDAAARIAELERISKIDQETVRNNLLHWNEVVAKCVELEKQRDKLLAALRKFVDSHEECTDFDWFTAQIVNMEDYHEAQEIADSVKEQA